MGRSQDKIGRNDPCPCGSGTKYKRCHGNRPKAAAPITVSEKRWLTEQMIRDPRFRIHYVVPHLKQDLRLASPLQLYTPGIINTAHVFAQALLWPADIREFCTAPTNVLIFRMLGFLDRQLIPIDERSFEVLVTVLPYPFKCVVSTAESYDFVSNALTSAATPWLHVATEAGKAEPFIEDVNVDVLRAYCETALDPYLRVLPDDNFAFYARQMLSDVPYEKKMVVKAAARRSGVTMPNELALEAFGYKFPREALMAPENGDDYVGASIDSALQVEAARGELLKRKAIARRNWFIVTVYSPAWGARKIDFDHRALRQSLEGRVLADVWASFLKQENHYTTFKVVDRDAVDNDPSVIGFIEMRRAEARAYIASLSAHAAHDMTPVLRFEPRANRIRGDLINIGNCARGKGPQREFKLRKLLVRMGSRLTSLVDQRYISVLDRATDRLEGLSLVTDLPLESAHVGGIPLALRYDCSRIPLNPGNLSFGELLSHKTLQVPMSRFRNVLVIRSFSRSDKLRTVLERAMRYYRGRTDKMPDVSIIDVNTPEEFVHATNAFTGAVLIFDGHGVRNPGHGTGTIVVGGNEMDLWLYRKELELPPIVLLSACDTIPLDGAHGAVASAMLAAGATTVVGTTLPIAGLGGATFVGRLLFRIAEFLPLLTDWEDRPWEWRGFLSGLLRMAHVSEIVKYAIDRFGAPERVFDEIQMTANTHINFREPDWHASVADEMRKLLPERVWTETGADHPLARPTEALRYVQVGHPELIHIVEDRSEDEVELSAQA